jgi:hypothetical protein
VLTVVKVPYPGVSANDGLDQTLVAHAAWHTIALNDGRVLCHGRPWNSDFLDGAIPFGGTGYRYHQVIAGNDDALKRPNAGGLIVELYLSLMRLKSGKDSNLNPCRGDTPDRSGRRLPSPQQRRTDVEAIDVAIRIGELPDSELHATRVGGVRHVVCASPDYLKRQGKPRQPSDLAAHQTIAPSGASNLLEWRFGHDLKTAVALKPRLVCNLNEAAIAAALDGFGVTRVLSYQVDEHLKSGRLVEVLPKFEADPIPIHVVRTGGHAPSAKVRAFVDMAVESLKSDKHLR